MQNQCLSSKKNNPTKQCTNVTFTRSRFCNEDHSDCISKYQTYKHICEEATKSGKCKELEPSDMDDEQLNTFTKFYRLISEKHRSCSNLREEFKNICIYPLLALTHEEPSCQKCIQYHQDIFVQALVPSLT